MIFLITVAVVIVGVVVLNVILSGKNPNARRASGSAPLYMNRGITRGK